jgi:hypothetical protein
MSVFQTPWKLVGRSGNDFEQIIDADRNVLIEEIGFDLGMFIVKAVNSNELLVKALEIAQAHAPCDLYADALSKAAGVK